MFVMNTPESVGISSELVLKFHETLEKHKLSTHSVVIARGNTIFDEVYYAPFHKDYKHRMYSVSKSFVSVAIGLAIEEGLLTLEDKFIKFFPEYNNGNLAPEMLEMTIENMLCMQTCNSDRVWWFTAGAEDRCSVYFAEKEKKLAGTTFKYDSPGSFMLGVIIEKLTGKTFLDYLKEKFLLKIGFSEDSYCLSCPGGHAFGDSAVMCSSRDLLTFARFVMNKGEWDGVRYMNKEYLEEATSKKVATDQGGEFGVGSYGYGYQIWQARHGFSFNGMGDQFAVCCPEKDLVFVINSDNQGNAIAKYYIEDAFNDIIYDNLCDEALPENNEAYSKLKAYSESQKLFALSGNKKAEMADKINGKTYTLSENPMGIKWLKVDLKDDFGTFTYENEQGEKQIKFGFGYNEFQKFPQTGYADIVATIPVEGHMYECACSAEWADEQKLLIVVQIIDKYFGKLKIGLSFRDDLVQVEMKKAAEAFLFEYDGEAKGRVK